MYSHQAQPEKIPKVRESKEPQLEGPFSCAPSSASQQTPLMIVRLSCFAVVAQREDADFVVVVV